MALTQKNNFVSFNDDESDLNTRGFSDYLLSRIAEDLLDDWVPVLLKLDLGYTYVKRIEKAYPDNLYRQALEGLSQWRKSIARTEVGMTDASNYLEIAFKEKGRQDLIDLMSKLKENSENQSQRKRCVETSESHSCKRKAIRMESTVCQTVDEILEYRIQYHLDMFDETEIPSTSTQHNHFQQEEKVSKTKKKRYTNQKLNNDILTVLVDHKSPILLFGKNIRKPRIALLLSTGSEYIKASAFGEHADFIDKNFENDTVYRISGYKLQTSDYSNPDLELTLYQSTNIQVVPSGEIPKQAKRKFRIDDIKQKQHVRHLRTVGPVVVTSVGRTRRPWRKFLKEVMLKDHSGTIIMNMWSLNNTISFSYKRGDVLELQNVEVGMFKAYSGTEYHLTGGDVVKFKQIHGYDMQDLLLNEDEQLLKPITMEIDNLHNLKKCKHLVYINFVKIEGFVKDSRREKIFKHCDVDETHGLLIEKEEGWFCDDCEEFTEGENKVKLTAEVVDAHENCTNSIWVSLYDKSAQTVLGGSYEKFLQTKNEKKRRSILRKCELENRVYRLELKFNPENRTQSVKKLTVI